MALDDVVPGFQRVLLLTCLATFVNFRVKADPYNTERAYDNIFTDPGVAGRFFESQIAHATEFDVLPSGSAPNIQPPGAPTYKIKRAKRSDVYKIMRPGTCVASELPHCVLLQKVMLEPVVPHRQRKQWLAQDCTGKLLARRCGL